MKTLKFKEFPYPQKLVDFVNENPVIAAQIVCINISLGKQVLYYWDKGY